MHSLLLLPKVPKEFMSAAAFEPGQRIIYSEDQGRKSGVIIKVLRDKKTLDRHGGSAYVVEFDLQNPGTNRVEVAQSELGQGAWTVLPGANLDSATLSALQFDYAMQWLRQKTAQAQERIACNGHTVQAPPVVAFYRPGAQAFGERSTKEPAGYSKEATDKACKDLRTDLRQAYNGIDFEVSHKKDKAFIRWQDGPVFIPRAITEKFLCTALQLDASLASASSKREISDSLIRSAISFVQCVMRVQPTSQAGALVDAHLYRTGVLQCMFLPTRGFDLSYASLVRLAIMRWDDHAGRFIGEGITRHLVYENNALFGPFGQSINDANDIMSEIRELAFQEQEALVLEEFSLDQEKGRAVF